MTSFDLGCGLGCLVGAALMFTYALLHRNDCGTYFERPEVLHAIGAAEQSFGQAAKLIRDSLNMRGGN